MIISKMYKLLIFRNIILRQSEPKETVTEIKTIFLNKEIRCGGFYELCIQVCPSSEMEPIKKYSNYIKSLEYVDGPFDDNFELTEFNIEDF